MNTQLNLNNKETLTHVGLNEVLRTVALLVGSDQLDTLLVHLVWGGAHLSGALPLLLQFAPRGLTGGADHLLARYLTLHLVARARAVGKIKPKSVVTFP